MTNTTKLKRIVHIDLNAFFVQCEILKNPDLKNKPVAIGSNLKRSVISTASYEARKYNVNSAMPVAIAKQNCPSLILVEPHFSLYKQYSNKFFDFLKNKYKILEVASIDECFIDMSEESKDVDDIHSYLFDLQMELFRKTDLKCSIGCSYNRFLAKMASDMKKPLGLTIINKEDIEKLIWPLSIDKFYGIGKKTAPQLKEYGIKTIGDLAKCDDIRVKKFLSNQFETLKNTACGTSNDFVDNLSYLPKSISSERTFSEDLYDFDDLKACLIDCCKQVHYELKKYNLRSHTIALKWRYNDFTTKSKQVTLFEDIKDLNHLTNESIKILNMIYDNKPIRLLGVSLENLAINDTRDYELLDNINSQLKFGGKIMYGKDKYEH